VDYKLLSPHEIASNIDVKFREVTFGYNRRM
jgi:hypothetical protein